MASEYTNVAIIKNAITAKFNVKPEAVNIVNMKGNWKRVGREYGLTPRTKKAIVTLKRGDAVDLFDIK